jgi:hypothetical protein
MKFHSDEKRFYVNFPSPSCPDCGSKAESVEDYLSYPTADVKINMEFFCKKCNPDEYAEPKTFTRKIVLRVYTELA